VCSSDLCNRSFKRYVRFDSEFAIIDSILTFKVSEKL
jgi:hypothetical protein